jgi:hypothetical protein
VSCRWRLHRNPIGESYVFSTCPNSSLTALFARRRPGFAGSFPEAKRAVVNRQFGPHIEPALFQIQQETAPLLRTFTHTVDEADELFATLRRRASEQGHPVTCQTLSSSVCRNSCKTMKSIGHFVTIGTSPGTILLFTERNPYHFLMPSKTLRSPRIL